METLTRLVLATGLLATAVQTPAQEEGGEVEQLRKQLQEMKMNFERTQQQQRDQIEDLQKQLDQLQQMQAAAPPATSAPPVAATAEQVQELNGRRVSIVCKDKDALSKLSLKYRCW